MVLHLPLFVEWPAAKLDPAHPHLNICLLGADPIEPYLEGALRSSGSQVMSVAIVHVSASDKLDQCHVLYIGASSRGNFTRLAAVLQQSSVLTVSERPLTSVSGEVVGLPVEDSHVRIEVDLSVASNSKLTVSSRLLQLASQVKR